MFNSLEGDGIIENIYHFLWTKDTIFNTHNSIYIPHTILYKYRKPLYWYFTSVIDHRLKKKNPDKLNKEHIKQAFLKNASKSGIICYFIYSKKSFISKYESDKPTFEKTMKRVLSYLDHSESNNQTENNNNSNNNKSSFHKNNFLKLDDYKINSSKYIIEYFDKKQFIEFLNSKPKCEEGILQKFEDPKGEYNSIYRIIWSPKLSLFEKCTNLKKLNDTHFDIYERAVTYDGEEFQIKTEPVKGSHLPQGMESIALKIADHVGNITLEKIRIVRLILNFKVDKRDRILFLWCSSLRIDPGNSKKTLYKQRNKSFAGVNLYSRENILETRIKSVDDSKIKLKHPDNINLFKYSILGKPIKPHKEAYCLNCGQNVENYKLYEISFKNLIESHENIKREKEYFPVYNNINMTSNGVEVISGEEKGEKKKKAEILNKLKEANYKNFIIPKVINELYPNLSYNDYNYLKKDSVFKNKKTFICDTCFLEITKYCSMGGSNNLYLLKTSKKEEKKIITNNFNLMRPKLHNFSDININMDKINNKEIILTHDQSNKKKRFLQRANSSGNNKINSYQNYLLNFNKNIDEEENILKNIVIQSYNENNFSDIINTKENNFKKNRLKLNQKINMKNNNTLNRKLNFLSKKNNKRVNEFFLKNKEKICKFAKFFSSETNKIRRKKNKNEFLDSKKKFPIKLKNIDLNSDDSGLTQD